MKTEFLTYLQERFGIPANLFDDFEFYGASKGRVYLGPKSAISSPEPVSVGFLAARIGNSIKPSTNLIQLFGKYATKNIINLNKENTIKYANGEDVIIDSKEFTDGYVILSYQGSPLGCGHAKGKTITNLLPKAKRLQLKFL
ncbi:hypothetical protein KKB44_06525 [Candidatus Micrarchaeota archaeon]|nr:hypothetical protein [Candidatus Micrarchaeota archaeon]